MSRLSAGLLMYRRSANRLEVFLVHPGGPFFKNKDEGAWTIPKGEPNEGEELLAAAQREFQEETGFMASGPYLSLGSVKQRGGKTVHAWAFAGDCEPAQLVSGTFTLEWPPKSGRQAEFPEVDGGAWFDLTQARQKINPAQIELLAALERVTSAQ